mgnify:CR=1 FL=1
MSLDTLDTRGVLVQESARGVRSGDGLRRDLRRAGDVPVARVHVGVRECRRRVRDGAVGRADAPRPRDCPPRRAGLNSAVHRDGRVTAVARGRSESERRTGESHRRRSLGAASKLALGSCGVRQ